MADKRKAGILLNKAALHRRYPDSGLASDICFDDTEIIRLPCRNLLINYHIGGGIPYGKIMEPAGEESVGKTVLAMDFAVCCQALGGMVLWDDAEAAFNGPWARKHGLDLSKVELLPYENEFEIVSDWVADMCIYYRSKLVNNEPILLVIDSVATMEGEDAMQVAEQDAKAEMGKRSFMMGKLLRKRNKIFVKYGICVMLVNQLRVKVGASQFEEKETTPLQQALKYYAGIKLWIFSGRKIKTDGKKGQWVGKVVYIRTKKNKTAIPRDNIQSEIYFVEHEGKFGFDKYFGLRELLLDKKKVVRNRGKYTRKGKVLAISDNQFETKIRTDQDFRSRMIKLLGINTVSKTREQIKALDKNLYPVKLKVKKGNDEDTDQ